MGPAGCVLGACVQKCVRLHRCPQGSCGQPFPGTKLASAHRNHFTPSLESGPEGCGTPWSNTGFELLDLGFRAFKPHGLHSGAGVGKGLWPPEASESLQEATYRSTLLASCSGLPGPPQHVTGPTSASPLLLCPLLLSFHLTFSSPPLSLMPFSVSLLSSFLLHFFPPFPPCISSEPSDRHCYL